MGWEGHDRDLPPDWPAIRGKFIRQRKHIDGGRCQKRLPSGARCPRPGTDVDHRSDRDDHTDLQLLCDAHHKAKTQQEARAPGQWARGSKKRPGEQHPGDLL
jgi:hypothetical protein